MEKHLIRAEAQYKNMHTYVEISSSKVFSVSILKNNFCNMSTFSLVGQCFDERLGGRGLNCKGGGSFLLLQIFLLSFCTVLEFYS